MSQRTAHEKYLLPSSFLSSHIFSLFLSCPYLFHSLQNLGLLAFGCSFYVICINGSYRVNGILCNQIIQCAHFYVLLSSLNIILARFIHHVMHFLRLLCPCLTILQLILLLIDIQIIFNFLPIINAAAMNTLTQCLLGDLCTDFSREYKEWDCCLLSHSHSKWSYQFILPPTVCGAQLLHIITSIFILGIPVGVEQDLIVVVICIFLVSKHLSIHLLAIWKSFLEKCLLKLFAQFLLVLSFSYWCVGFFIISGMRLLSDTCFECFVLSVVCLFTLLMTSFAK